MKCLVTGASGFIGSNLVKCLLKEGNSVTGVDDLSSGHLDLVRDVIDQSDFNLLIDDFSADLVINSVREGRFDVIFHLAAIPRVSYSVENPYETTDNNVSKTVRLMEACKDSKTRFIFSSSSSVYGGSDVLPTPVSANKNPRSPYAWQKSAIEDLINVFVELYEMDAVSLRYFNVFGPGQYGNSPYSTAVSAWCHAIKNNKSLRKDGTGEQSRDMCYIDNVVDVNIRAAQYSGVFKGEKLNVSCGDRVSNNQILEKFKEKFGELNIKNEPFRAGDVMHTQADISETQRILGYEPLVRFWEGLDQTFKWWNL